MGFFSKILGGAENLLTGGSGAAANKMGQQIGAGQSWLNNIYNTTAGQENPFIQSGTSANKTLMDILTGNNTHSMDSFFNSSTYKFPLQQGLQQINNSMAAKGLGNSTAALRNAGGFTEGLASQGFQGFINNLMNMSNAGQQGIATQANTGVGLAPSYTSLTGQMASAKGASAAAPWAAGSSLIGNLLGSSFGGGGDMGAGGNSPWGTVLSNTPFGG